MKEKTETTLLLNGDAYNERAIRYIKQVVADYYKLDHDVYLNKSRQRLEINVKHTAIYFCYKNLKITQAKLGKYFNVDHASIIHISKKMSGLLEWDRVLMKEYEEIQALIEFKGLETSKVIDIDNEYYFINLNDVHSAKIDKNKSIVFTGFEVAQIESLLNTLGATNPIVIKKHEKTGMYIMEKINNNKNDNTSSNNNEPGTINDK